MDLQNEVMKAAMRFHVGLYRRSAGRLGRAVKGVPVLLLTVPGRRTGVPRTGPVCYLRSGQDLLLVGSAGGMDWEPQWFRNLRRASTVEVEIGGNRHRAAVHITEGAERDARWAEVVAQAPFFDGYAEKTTRVIPVAVLSRLTPGTP